MLSVLATVAAAQDSGRMAEIGGFPGRPLKCLDGSTVEKIRSDPSTLTVVYSDCHHELSERLASFGFDEQGLKAAFAAISAHAMAPYGSSQKFDLADLLREQHLDCDNYAVLTGYFVRILLPDHPDTFAMFGVDGGKVGNHAQVLLKVAEHWRILADPTVGIIAMTDYNALLSGKPVPPEQVRAFYAYNDPEVLKFGAVVYDAITSGAYRPSDALYYFWDLQRYISFARSIEAVSKDPPDVDAIVRLTPTPGARHLEKVLSATRH